VTGAADDPLGGLRLPHEPPIRPRAAFVAELRARLGDALGLDAPAVPDIALPPRRTAMPSTTELATTATALTPYLAVGSDAVLALLAATVWALRATAASRRARQGLAVESALSLGDKRSLVIVVIEGRRLLVGVAPGGVSLITELHPPFGDALAQSLQKHEPPS